MNMTSAVSKREARANSVTRLFLLQVGRIEQHQPGELTRGGGCDYFTTEASFREKRQASAMIKMGMCQQDIIDCRRIKTEGTRILLCKFMLALV